jgi:D-tyrosyl-tRNA(Tyr) deacylase
MGRCPSRRPPTCVRSVVQRVSSASVTVDGGVVARIGTGLLALIGVAEGDAAADVEYMATKIHDMRVFPDEQGRMNRSVSDAGGAVLVISQFTLLGDLRKGRRPAFDAAADLNLARSCYEQLVSRLRDLGLTVHTGVFQAQMDVALVNDGPVSLLLDSRRLF